VVGFVLAMPFGGAIESDMLGPSFFSLLAMPVAILTAFFTLLASIIHLGRTDPPPGSVGGPPEASPSNRVPAVRTFPHVRVWGPDGRVADDHPLLTTEMAGQVARYLDAAPVALRLESVAAAGPASDDNHVARSVRTDGRWVWDDNLAHYVRTFRWAPVPEEFVRDVRARNFQLPLISEDQILWAGQYLEQVRPREWTPAQSG